MFSNRKLLITIAYGAALLVLGVAVAVTRSDARRLRNEIAELKRAVQGINRTLLSQEKPVAVSPLLLDYRLDVPGRGEVFPAMFTSAVPEYWPVAVLRITNSAKSPSAQVISAEIPGWSRVTKESVVVRPLEARQVRIQANLLPRAYLNNEIQRATLEIRATGLDGTALYAESHPVLIHGGSEIYWGRQFSNAQMAARWVTPHDSSVLELVSRARSYMPRGRMAGYDRAAKGDAAIARHVRAQAEAIYRTLQRSGISYVSGLFVMGEFVDQAQRIRLPRDVLSLRNANCMDISVTFASAIESLDMQSVLVIVPGHAFTGVRLAPDSEDILYLDLTVLPKGSFDSAITRARQWLRKTPPDQTLVVDVSAARALGIYPLAPIE